MIAQDLDKLEEESVYVLREAKKRFKKLCCLWSMGKDSTVTVALSRKAFFGKVPYPLVYINNGIDFQQTYDYRDKMVKDWGLELIEERSIIKDDDISGVSCCGANKTEALMRVLDEHGFDGVIVSIRRDEHGIRSKERVFSPRDQEFRWNYKDQPAEMWGEYTSKFDGSSHVRIHPLLHWNEIDAWRYVQREKIPVNPLYFAKNGKRYRSLGCTKCTVAVDSDADSVDKIIEELKTTQVEERSGRAQDKEKEHVMQRLRALGYM
ncbi:sulfate adenylyltransferase [Candidatus Micrarchaeota archaeon CG_4_10_14_0_2_um_filter_55_9]|nr:MAG: sulfate adenylyltransferase [Candidatus Micrarchaeota archaeon CG09_land_8_20_14_0_10_55_25]PIZ91728.1 MAG: sulfate adenylyltransferase [Candidatus Micrarchaeota archaeon CG_4_10_14_0_2_um_filter_55_9]PJD01269.1 MAG: sulfate adenylyltransferase [Candidatus Micrarchaeota archaeon CG10_big_fil_rev_8_21_14_0_10_54_18]